MLAIVAWGVPLKGRRLKIWWRHDTYRRIESIYSPDETVAITAYHVDVASG